MDSVYLNGRLTARARRRRIQSLLRANPMSTSGKKKMAGRIDSRLRTATLAATWGDLSRPIVHAPGRYTMISSLGKKVLFLAVILPVLGLVIASSPLSVGQDKAAGEKKVQKGTRRLPAYYADVVTDDQRKAIYDIQAKYAKQLQDLNEQLLALTKKQNDEIEAVLTAEQKEKVAAA